jgi:hypothetical protein
MEQNHTGSGEQGNSLVEILESKGSESTDAQYNSIVDVDSVEGLGVILGL